MIRFLTALALIVVSTVAHAQQNLQVRGPITIGNCFKSASPTIAVDAGVTCGGGGGGTTPGGNPGQVQFNNSGSFGGIAGQTTDGTITTFASGDFVLAGSGSGSVTLNAPATGGGTVTLFAGSSTVAGLGITQTFTAPQTIGTLTVTTAFTATGLVTNADLANPSVTVNGQVCTLGLSCVVTSAGVITIGVTTISGGTNGNIEFNNAGILGEKGVTGSGNVVLVTSPTIASPTITGAFTATGLVTNADLVSASMTISGTVCTLGGTCTLSVSASSITPGTTTIVGATAPCAIENSATTVMACTAETGTGNFVKATNPSIATLTVTAAFIATGLVTNADLVNTSVTVGGATCTLGGSCAPGLTIGAAIASGVANGLLYQNASNLLANSAAVNSQGWSVDANSASCPTLVFAAWAFCQSDGSNGGIGIYGNGSGGATLTFVNNAGTLASKTVSTTTQTLMQILVQGYDGTFQIGAEIFCVPTQTWTGSAHGTRCTFSTTPNGSVTNTLALTIDQDQSITVAGGVKTTTGNFSGGLTTNVTGSTQCVQANSAGLLSGTGSACGGGAVSSVSNSDSSLTISPTTGAVVASLNVGHANTWSATQTFPDGGAWSSSGLGVGGALSSTFNFTDNGSGAVILTGGNPGNIVGHYNGGNVPAVWGVQYVYTSLPQNRGIGIFIDVSHQDTTANHSASGMDINVSTPSTYSTTVNNLTAISPSVKHIGTGNVTSISTVLALAYLNSTATVTSMWPFRAILQSDAGGTVTNAVGFEIATPMGPTTVVTSVWTNVSGIEILDQNPSVSGGGANTLTNPPSAIKIQSQTAAGAFAIQQLGSGLNSFAGAATFSTSVTIGAGSAITSSGPGGVMGSNAFNSTAFAPLASPTFTGTVTLPDGTVTSAGHSNIVALGINQAAPSTFLLGVTGTSQTGSSANGIVNLSQTWNTSGGPTALTVAVTNTASTGGLLLNLLAGAAGATSEFSVSPNGSVTGAGNLSFAGGSLTVLNSGNLTFNTRGIITSPAAATIQLGPTASASAATAQTLQAQGSSGASLTGPTFTVSGSNQTGTTSIGGNLDLHGGTGTSTNGIVTLSLISSDAGLTDTTVCQDTTLHGLHAGTGTAGICLGNVSSIRFKPDYKLITDGLGVIRGLDPGTYHYAGGIADGGKKLQVGFTAERYAVVMPSDFTRRDAEGKPNGLDMLAALPYAVRAIQQVSDEVDELKAANDNLRHEVETLRSGTR